MSLLKYPGRRDGGRRTPWEGTFVGGEQGIKNGRRVANGKVRGSCHPGCHKGGTVARGATGVPARVGTGHRRAGQPLAGHRAIQAEAAAAGVSRLEKVLLVADRDHIP